MKPAILYPVRDIPPERKTLYTVGLVVGVIGFLLFMSLFLSMILAMTGVFGHLGDRGPDSFDGVASSMARVPWYFLRGFIGFLMIVAGGVMMGIAARGLAGSGVLLDPQQARRDLEPWNRSAGGMMSDALDEIPAVQKVVDRLTMGEQTVEVVKVRCPKCQSLNDEHNRYCGQCGGAL